MYLDVVSNLLTDSVIGIRTLFVRHVLKIEEIFVLVWKIEKYFNHANNFC